MLESPRIVSVKAPVEMRLSIRNSIRQMDRGAMLLRVSVSSCDDFALAREKAYSIFDFGETAFEFFRIAVIILRA